jgi:hypothetical protein
MRVSRFSTSADAVFRVTDVVANTPRHPGFYRSREFTSSFALQTITDFVALSRSQRIASSDTATLV